MASYPRYVIPIIWIVNIPMLFQSQSESVLELFNIILTII